MGKVTVNEQRTGN